jgi:hypothetical protein
MTKVILWPKSKYRELRLCHVVQMATSSFILVRLTDVSRIFLKIEQENSYLMVVENAESPWLTDANGIKFRSCIFHFITNCSIWIRNWTEICDIGSIHIQCHAASIVRKHHMI